MRSFWVDFPVSAEQYSRLELRWRRRQNYYEIKNPPPPDVRIRSFCTFGGEDYSIISLEARGDIDAYNYALQIMDQWIVENLREY